MSKETSAFFPQTDTNHTTSRNTLEPILLCSTSISNLYRICTDEKYYIFKTSKSSKVHVRQLLKREYELGKELLETYEKQGVTLIPIENHNNIEEMRKKQNSEFANMKQNLVIGVRKTHKFIENHKVSDYLAPYTSSGCIAMCMYCYLVCN